MNAICQGIVHYAVRSRVMKLLPLDKLFSAFIRRRAMSRVGGCERCLRPKTDYKQLQCSHFHGRAKKSVRWDEDNAVGLCYGCHKHLTSFPLEHTDWFREHLGELNFDLLEARMRVIGKPDREALTLYYKSKVVD